MTQETKPSRKTLVIGSTGHRHCTCSSWADVNKINVVDFDLVVVSMRSLTPKVLKGCGAAHFADVRKSLSRLLASYGTIVVLGDEYAPTEVNRNTTVDN